MHFEQATFVIALDANRRKVPDLCQHSSRVWSAANQIPNEVDSIGRY